MSKPRVKVYGFLSLTKRQYLLSLVLGLILLVALMAYWFLEGVKVIKHPLAPYLPLVVLAAVALEAVEVVIVLGKFRRLDAAEKEKQGSNPSAPAT
jgi:uncharacterized membrane protein